MKKTKINEIIKMIDDALWLIYIIRDLPLDFDWSSSDNDLAKIQQKFVKKLNQGNRPELIYSIDDLEELFRVSQGEIYEWNRFGLLNFIHSRDQVFVTSTQLNEFIRKYRANLLNIRRRLNHD